MNAHEQYTETRKKLELEIEILKQKLEALDIEEKNNSKNWGFAGSCGHILEEIENLNYGFMGEL